MIECRCNNSKNKPKEIPQHKWVVEGEIYHITFIYNMVNQAGILGCTISEISLDDLEPYNCYNLARFSFTHDNFLKLLELAKDCAEFNDLGENELEELFHRELVEV